MTKWTFIPSQDGSPPELRTPDGKDPFCLNDLTAEEADGYAERIVEAMNEGLGE